MNIDRIVQFYKQFIPENGMSFDIGANEGHWSAGFSLLCKTVIALEPQTSVFDRLQQRFKRTNVTTIHQAVGAYTSIGRIKMPRENSLGRSGVGTMSDEFIKRMGPETFNLSNGWDDEETVNITTLDVLINAYGVPDFIKIDVEGYEAEVIQGLSSKWLIPLSIEFHPVFMEPVEKALSRLSYLGYTEFNYDLLANFNLELPHWVDFEEIEKEIQQFGNRIDIFGDIYAR